MKKQWMLFLGAWMATLTAEAQIGRLPARYDMPYLRREAYTEQQFFLTVDKQKLGLDKAIVPSKWTYRDLVMRNYNINTYLQTPWVINEIQTNPDLYGLLGENPNTKIAYPKIGKFDLRQPQVRLRVQPFPIR